MITDGSQPVGRGIGPALEARDILSVLKCEEDAPCDLRERALLLAAGVLEFSPDVNPGEGLKLATGILDSGKAFRKFQAICVAQGGMKEIPTAKYTYSIVSKENGEVSKIDNRQIAKIAKLTGAPEYKVGGIDMHIRVGEKINKGDRLFTLHADSKGILDYTLDYLKTSENPIKIMNT
jgi:thymidine phosphorylase